MKKIKTEPTHKKKWWRIIFINDLHGHFDGFYVDQKTQSAGLGYIAHWVNNVCLLDATSEFRSDLWTENTPLTGLVLCLGGDMVRKYTHRLLHKNSAKQVWDAMIKCLKLNAPDNIRSNLVIVLGNHELKDFGVDFAKYVIESTHDVGCTRNIVWKEDSPPKSESALCDSGEKWIPKSSIHRYVDKQNNKGTQLCFVGLVDDTKVDISPYSLRSTCEVISQVLVPYCFQERHCAKDRVIVHLAHYEGGIDPNDIKHGTITPEAFGVIWVTQPHRLVGNQVRKENWCTPHFILKGHDHNCSWKPCSGNLLYNERYAIISTESKKPTKWVPTFSAGADGEAIGMLDILLDENKEIRYRWEAKEVPHDSEEQFIWEVPENIAIAWEGMWFKKGLTFRSFGRAQNDPNLLVHSMDLLLKSLLHTHSNNNTFSCIAIASPSSILPHSKIPGYLGEHWRISIRDIEPFLTEDLKKKAKTIDDECDKKEIVQSAWIQKIDEWDLRAVYGDEGWHIYPCFNVDSEQLINKILCSFSSPKFFAQSTKLPPTEKSLSGQYILGESIWIMIGDRTIVFVKEMANTLEMNCAITPYELICNEDSGYSLKFLGESVEEYIRNIVGKGEVCAHTTAFMAERAFGQPRRKNEDNEDSVFMAVRKYLDDFLSGNSGDIVVPRPLFFY